MLWLGLAYATGLFHALYLFRLGLVDTGGVVAYFGLLRMLEFPTFTSSFAYTQISSGISGARRILELINHETDLDQNTLGRAATIRGEIEFRGVAFRYPLDAALSTNPGISSTVQPSASQQEPVLNDISFRVKPGQTVAIVGQTGSGKTSLVRLINRTYDVESGTVLVDGVDVRDWNLAALRSQISMIEQDIFLFSRSVSDNIAFGKPGSTRAEVLAAAEAAQAHGSWHLRRAMRPYRRARRDPLGRSASAPGARARIPHRSPHPDPGRRHLGHRFCDRRPHPARHRECGPRPHHHLDHAPPFADVGRPIIVMRRAASQPARTMS
jgi:ABC-type multidrug transport system fused ATPase/permease subunit